MCQRCRESTCGEVLGGVLAPDDRDQRLVVVGFFELPDREAERGLALPGGACSFIDVQLLPIARHRNWLSF
jgi:hypothetical protein